MHKKKIFSKNLKNKEVIAAKYKINEKISHFEVKNKINKVVEGQIQSIIILNSLSEFWSPIPIPGHLHSQSVVGLRYEPSSKK